MDSEIYNKWDQLYCHVNYCCDATVHKFRFFNNVEQLEATLTNYIQCAKMLNAVMIDMQENVYSYDLLLHINTVCVCSCMQQVQQVCKM